MPLPVIRNTVVLQPRKKKKGGFILDDISGSVSAYSLRRLRTAYTNSAIRVRRSGDNAEQDIGFTASGDLDTSELTTFVGANSAYIAKWYDQSGNGNDAVQTTADNQPRIVNTGVVDVDANGKPNVVFESTRSTYLSIASNNSIKPTIGITLNAIAYNSNWSTMADSRIISCTEGGGYQIAMNEGSNNPSKIGALFKRNAVYGIVGYNLSNLYGKIIATSLYDGRYSKLYINSIQRASDDAGALYPLEYGPIVPLLIAAEPGPSNTIGNYTNIVISEITLYSSALTDTQRIKLESNQKTYYSIT